MTLLARGRAHRVYHLVVKTWPPMNSCHPIAQMYERLRTVHPNCEVQRKLMLFIAAETCGQRTWISSDDTTYLVGEIHCNR